MEKKNKLIHEFNVRNEHGEFFGVKVEPTENYDKAIKSAREEITNTDVIFGYWVNGGCYDIGSEYITI